MQNLLVTGGCGFIGANFIRYLFEEAGFEGRVINLDALTYAAHPASLAGIAARAGERYRLVQASICDAAAVARALDEYAVDTICHFAAESHVDRSIVAPEAFVQTNIVGTYVLLQAARERCGRLRRFHHVRTDEVFGSLGPRGRFSETTPYHPNSPYSASKAASDHLVRAYHATYGLPVTLSNCSNNYGPLQFPEKLIPLMLLNGLEGRPLPVYGNGRQVRDWLYVRDHCEALWTILRHGCDGRTYNVGGKAERRNIEVVERLCDLLDELASPLAGGARRRTLIRFVTDRPGHDLRYAMNTARIEEELGWQPRETFESGLRKTVQWYLANATWVDQVRSGAYREWLQTHYGGGAVGSPAHRQ